MLIDANQVQQDLLTDVCIIGAGPAGLALAVHLLRKGIDTVVLAGGGENPDDAHQKLARVVQAGIPTDDTTRGNVRALGGTSHVWGGYCLRMESLDFERRAWIPNSGWPIALRDLDPFYAEAARFCGIANPDFDPVHQLSAEQVERGALLSNPILKNFVIHVSPVRFGARYRNQLLASKTTTVCLLGIAVELETAPGASHVTAVRCRTLAGHAFRVRARTVVVATGAIQNARLLLNSRSTNPNGLGNDRDVVGRYFMQHPVHRHGALLAVDHFAALRLGRDGRVPGVGIASAFTEGLQHQRQLPSCHFLLAGSDYTLDDVTGIRPKLRMAWRRFQRVYLQPAPQQVVPRLMSWFARGDSSIRASTFGPVYLRPEQIPMPDSRITLSEELDPLGYPAAKMDWRLSELDWQFADRCLFWIGCATGSEGIGRVQIAAGAARETARSFLHGGYHYYGTTRMNEDARFGVVDKNCKVHGVDNLYVAGSSVFPTSGYANPTFTIVALALRLAAHLDHSRSGPA